MLTGRRAEIVQRRVEPTPIMERFDVGEKITLGLVAGVLGTVMHQFALQRPKEALHRSIVVPIASAIHWPGCRGSLTTLDTCHWCTDCLGPSDGSGPNLGDAG